MLDKLERVDEAEAAYLRAIELRPGYSASYAPIAQFYNLRNDYQKASDYYGRALKLSPDNARVLFSLGLVFTNEGRYDQAVKVLERAIQLRPYLAPPYTNLGLAYLRARRYNGRSPRWRSPSRPWELSDGREPCTDLPAAGRKDEARQKYQFAIRDGEQRLQQNPRDHGIELLVGRYYAMLGRKPEALRHLDLALLQHPDDAHYLTIAATAHVALGDRGTALSLMEQAARLGHRAASFWQNPSWMCSRPSPGTSQSCRPMVPGDSSVYEEGVRRWRSIPDNDRRSNQEVKHNRKLARSVSSIEPMHENANKRVTDQCTNLGLVVSEAMERADSNKADVTTFQSFSKRETLSIHMHGQHSRLIGAKKNADVEGTQRSDNPFGWSGAQSVAANGSVSGVVVRTANTRLGSRTRRSTSSLARCSRTVCAVEPVDPDGYCAS